MSITITPEVPLPTKTIPDYSPGVSIAISAVPQRPASSIKMNGQVAMTGSEYTNNYTFDINSSAEATEANTLYPLAWNFYFNDGTTYTTVGYSSDRAKKLLQAINFYLYYRSDKETVNVEFNSDRELIDKGHEVFTAPETIPSYTLEGKPSTETLLSELYYGSDQTQGNTGKTRLPVPASELNISVAEISQLRGLSPYLSGAYAGQKPVLR